MTPEQRPELTPAIILRPFLNRYDLPPTLVHLLYLLIQREIEQNFPAFPNDPAMSIARGLQFVLERLPRIYDAADGMLSATLDQLAGITEAEQSRFYDFQAKHRVEQELAKYQRQIDYKEPGEDVSFARVQVRELKGTLKNFSPNLPYFWSTLFSFNVSFEIPPRARAEHCLVLGSTGSGKTSILEKLIYADIQTDATVIVMTLKGSLLPSLARLKAISPDRLIYFRPNNLIPLNPFALDSSSSTVDLISQIFASSDPTSKQFTLIKYCIRLVQNAKGSLRDFQTLMKSAAVPERYLPYVRLLSQSGQEFFLEQFGAKGEEGYAATKKQVLWRLDGILGSELAEAVFCQPHNALDMSEIFESGKVVLLDTSEAEFGESGCEFIGKYFLALVALAAKRTKPTRPVYFYIDEAANYLTPNIGKILDRAREAQVGLTLALLKLSDLKDLELTVRTNTKTKIIGHCNDDDARKLQNTLRVDFMELHHQTPFHFKLHVHGFLRSTIETRTTQDFLVSQPQRSADEMRELQKSVVHTASALKPEPEPMADNAPKGKRRW